MRQVLKKKKGEREREREICVTGNDMIMEVHGRCRKDTFGGVGRKRQLYNIL